MVQPGSHKRRFLPGSEFGPGGGLAGQDYNDAILSLFQENQAAGLVEVPIVAQKGDVLFFTGGLAHRGGTVEEGFDRTASRHVFAVHYVPSCFLGDMADRNGAGTARQYENVGVGGLGRWSLDPRMHYPALENPTSMFFGVLPDGSGRAFLRSD